MDRPLSMALLVLATFGLATPTANAARSVKRCIKISQKNGNNNELELQVKNTCKVELECSWSWDIVCEDLNGAETNHPASATFVLPGGTRHSGTADPSICGDQAWRIENISWQCTRKK